jgi:hypothetical protein
MLISLEDAHDKYYKDSINEPEKNIPKDEEDRLLTNKLQYSKIMYDFSYIIGDNKKTYKISLFKDTNCRFVKNVKINKKYHSNIDYVELAANGETIDRVYYSIYDILVKYYNIKNNNNADDYGCERCKRCSNDYYLIPIDMLLRGIPAIQYTQIYVIIHFKENRGYIKDFDLISAEYYDNSKIISDKIILANGNEDSLQYVTSQLGYYKIDYPYNGSLKSIANHIKYKYRLNLGNPIKTLIIRFYENPSEDFLEIHIGPDTIRAKLLYIYDTYFVYDLGLLNFRNIDDEVLLYYNISDIYSINLRLFRMRMGVVGLA